MISPTVVALEQRLASALGNHYVKAADRTKIRAAFSAATSWEDLPADVQRLVERIEKSPAKG